MQVLNRRNFPGAQYPDKIIQFGEGNFLRAFIDWQIDQLNELTSFNAGVVIVRPINTEFPPSLSTQDGLYTTVIRGLNETGEAVRDFRLIRSVNRELNCYTQFADVLALAHNPDIRFVFSNTTEAGITYVKEDQPTDTPPSSFPAKLTRLLYERFLSFDGASDKGWVLLPCELIDYNGVALRELVLRYAHEWKLPAAFSAWVEDHNTFCSTLVDRIVTGFPRSEHDTLQQELGYQDQFMDTAEYFYLFVIQGPQWLQQALCLDKLPAGKSMNIKIVDDIKPYKERKVAILNGAHTSMVPVAFQCGINTVGEAMNDETILNFVNKTLHQEIIPTLDLPKEELESFASDVLSRFRNPFIQHQLLSIALNSMAKFKTRILPQLLNFYKETGKLPEHLCFSLAALLAFYRGERLNHEAYELHDDAFWLEHFSSLWSAVDKQLIPLESLVRQTLAQKQHWDQDLTEIPGLVAQVTNDLKRIRTQGMRDALLVSCK